MDTFMKEFDIFTMENENMYETAFDKLCIRAMEIQNLVADGFITESSDDEHSMYEEAVSDFLASVKKFFENLLEKIKEFFEKAIFEVRVRVEANEMLKKLKNAKKIVLNRQESLAKFKGKKFTFIDSAKLNKNISEILKTQYIGLKRLANTKFKSFEEYEKALDKYCEEMDMVSSKITLEDWATAHALDLEFDKAFEYSEKELENLRKINELYYDMIKKMVNETSDAVQKKLETEEDLEYTHQICNSLKTVTSKTSRFMMNIVNKISQIPAKNFNKFMSSVGSFVGMAAGALSANTTTGIAVKGAVGAIAGGVGGELAGNVIHKAATKASGKNVDSDSVQQGQNVSSTGGKDSDNDGKAAGKN